MTPIETTLTVADAIRLGSLMRKQGYGDVYTETSTCAFGAALDAIGLNGSYHPGLLPVAWKALFDRPATCPECGHVAQGTCGIIVHLNDYHLWTRQEIADWVETVEARADQAVEVSFVAA